MLLLREPPEETVRRFLAAQAASRFSYPEVGATREGPPQGYTVDRHRIRLGEGEQTFWRAAAALGRWEMFRLGWVRLCWPDAPIAPGTTVGILVHRFGLWWLNACRIVYVIEEARRFGFAYGTLPDHAECGEERFTVEIDPGDGSVWYDILAFSRPRALLARIGHPVARALQREFARGSLAAMARAL